MKCIHFFVPEAQAGRRLYTWLLWPAHCPLPDKMSTDQGGEYADEGVQSDNETNNMSIRGDGNNGANLYESKNRGSNVGEVNN